MVSREPVLLIVAADRRELAGLARRLTKTERPDFGLRWSRQGTLGRKAAVLAASGAGRVNAARAVKRICSTMPVRAVVSTGVCGALDPALAVGDVVVADRVISSDPPGEYAAQRPGGSDRLARGGLLTVDRVVRTAAEKRKLLATGAVAVDMEAAGIAAAAQQHGLPFYCVRVVSDGAEQSLEIDYNRAWLADGRFSAARIVMQAGLSPGRWKELAGLWRATRSASETLGELLERLEFEA